MAERAPSTAALRTPAGQTGPLSQEAARSMILAGLTPLAATEVALADALGRVLVEAVRSRLTLPPWDNSAMDGYAVRASDVAAASPAAPAVLRVVGEAAAGHLPSAPVRGGTAVRVLTGGLVPEGADAVVPVEDTDAEPGAATLPTSVAIRAPGRPGQHVRRAGSDVRRGDVVAPAGSVVTPALVGALAATGHATVVVHRRPRVAILSTGDELVPVGAEPGPASIPDSNAESLAAQTTATGAVVVRLGIARDDLAEVGARLRRGIAEADVVIVSGGVSVGAHDVVRTALEDVGELRLWRVAIQPGKPLAFGAAARPDGGACLLFGLPGNPVSSFVTFELFVRPALRTLAGHRDPDGRIRVLAELAEAVSSPAERRSFLRVRLEPTEDGDGRYRARTAGGQGSHVLSALAAAHGLAVVPESVTSLPAGAQVEVIRLDAERW